ncbi:MAG: zf-HC2 domain-containing protein [Myxococcales bacterium]|nr:zf-HC2 domain-containing protein [Myxococcales bacterium]
MSPSEMTRKLAQLHPEDLIDKEARGDITEDELVRLEAHVAICSACRAERLMRADFEDEGGDRISFTNLVEGALGALAAPPVDGTKAPEPADVKQEPPGSPELAPPKRRTAVVVAPRPWKRVAILLAAAFVLFATVAYASEGGRALARKVSSMLGAESETREKVPSPVTPASLPAVAPAALPSKTELPTAVDSPTEPSVASPPVPPAPIVARAVVEPGKVSHMAPSEHAASTGIERPSMLPSSSAGDVTPLAVPPPSPPAEPEIDAATAFGHANALRHRGDRQGALAAYGDLVARFPKSREAATAQALRGRILLEEREAVRALSAFDAYLATGRGELREEAMAGRARAYAMLGRADGERAAWEALLSAYPHGPSSEHARLRVGALSGR